MKTLQTDLGWNSLPAALRKDLVSLAVEFRAKGLDLFLFGSFAENRAAPGSDLDLAYSGSVSNELERSLFRKIQELRTIRRIDLVKLSSASDSIAEEVRRNGVRLDQL